MSDKLTDLAVADFTAMQKSVWRNLLTATEIHLPKKFSIPPLDFTAKELFSSLQVEIQNNLANLEIPSFKYKPPEIDFDSFYKDVVETTEKLSRHLWSLPWHMSLPEMQELVKLESDKSDEYFEGFFSDSAFDRLQREILSDSNLTIWKALLEQCFENYRRDSFCICIPSLIVVLEGSFNHSSFFSSDHRKRFFETQIHKATGVNKVAWISLRAFCEALFAPNTGGKRLTRINRHKIMHGFDDPATWKRVDCLRLFQALDSTRRMK